MSLLLTMYNLNIQIHASYHHGKREKPQLLPLTF